MSENSSSDWNNSSTGTNSSSLRTPSQSELYVWFSTMLSVAYIGSLFYIILLISLLVSRKYKSGSEILLLHLFLCELSACCFFVPVSTIQTFYFYTGRQTSIPCQHLSPTAMIQIHANHYATLLLAINRFIAIVYPLQYRRWSSKLVTFLTIISGWMIAIALNMPTMYGVGARYLEFPKGSNFCRLEILPGMYAHIWAALSVYFPLCLSLLIYSVIYVKTLFRNNRVQAVKGGVAERIFKKKVRLVRILFLCSLWYAACFLTPSVYQLIVRIMSPRVLLWWRFVLLLGYVVSPFVFFSLNADYRNGLLKLCRKASLVAAMATDGGSLGLSNRKNQTSS